MSREQIVRAFMGKAEAQDDQMLAGQLEKTLTIPATSILFNIDQKADKSNASDMLLYAFVRVFDEVNICSFQGHCYCRRRPIALFDDYCGSRPPLLRIKATGC